MPFNIHLTCVRDRFAWITLTRDKSYVFYVLKYESYYGLFIYMETLFLMNDETIRVEGILSIFETDNNCQYTVCSRGKKRTNPKFVTDNHEKQQEIV